MILGILPEQGGSLAGLRRTGQDSRFLDQYVGSYVREFDEVHYFSYARDRLDRAVAGNFHLHPNPGLHRWLYCFLLPVLNCRAVRRCSVLRVMQATGAIPARIARSLFGVPFVVTYGYHYSTELRAQGRRLRAWLFDRRSRWAVRSADGVIVTTPTLRDFVAQFAPAERIALIPNSVDTERFSPAGQAVEKPAGRRRLIAVGNLTANKNHRLILEAVALLRSADFEVVVIGAGPEESSLRETAARNNVLLRLVGVVAHENIPAWLRSADLYLITSLSEGHPKSLLEAMSVGLPCIGTNVRGIRDVIAHGRTGWLCAPDREALASTIQSVLSDENKARAVGEAARRFVVENHSAQVIMAREIDFLKAVARRARRGERL